MKSLRLVMLAGFFLTPAARPQDALPPPRVTHVRTDCINGTVTVMFTKPVFLDGDYTLGNSASVVEAPRYGTTLTEVILTPTTLHTGTSYPLTVTGVRDLDAPECLIEPNPTQWSIGCGADCGSILLTSRIGADGRVTIEWAALAAVLQSSTNLQTWLDLSSATSPYLASPPLQTVQFFRLRCDDSSGPAPVLLHQPNSALAPVGSTVRLRAAVTGLAPLSYQWLFNDTNLAGATNQTLMLAGLNCVQAGVYELRATNSFGAVTSRVAYVAASNDACGLAFNTTFAEPPVAVLLLSSQNLGGLVLNTTLAEPSVRMLLISSQNPPDFPLNTTIAQPPVTTLLLSENPSDLPLNTTMAEPPTRVLLVKYTNPPDFLLNTSVAMPLVALLVGTNQTGAPFGNSNGVLPFKLNAP